jgi:ABC-type oligopeptide transport system, periplasmic component
MKTLSALLLVLFSTLPVFSAEPETFKLHLSVSPKNMDPNLQRGSASSYVLGNLYRNIFIYDDQAGLVPDLGVGCVRSNKGMTLKCTLKNDLTWSDKSSLTSSDFLRTYLRILDPAVGAFRADLLFKIKNAKAIYEKKSKPETLGVKTPDATTLIFEFAEKDPDFEYNLTTFLLAPTKADLSVTNGPYKIKEFKAGKRLLLESNTEYHQKNSKRPLVEFLFIEEDSVALQLYEKNQLTFLRRLPTLYIPKFKTRKDFIWMPLLRFDYIGFGPALKDDAEVRKALSYSLNFVELQKILSSDGLPGCAGLPSTWFSGSSPCVDFSLSKVPQIKRTQTYKMIFSSQGGEDHKRATEWMQQQWKKNAGLQVTLEVKENKLYLDEVKNNPPALFRKGLSPDRPTCLAVLETFASGNPENYIRFSDVNYEKVLVKLADATKIDEQKKLCSEGVQILLDQYRLIPTGPMHFAMLAKSNARGWKLNQMNQLDLSLLEFQH